MPRAVGHPTSAGVRPGRPLPHPQRAARSRRAHVDEPAAPSPRSNGRTDGGHVDAIATKRRREVCGSARGVKGGRDASDRRQELRGSSPTERLGCQPRRRQRRPDRPSHRRPTGRGAVRQVHLGGRGVRVKSERHPQLPIHSHESRIECRRAATLRPAAIGRVAACPIPPGLRREDQDRSIGPANSAVHITGTAINVSSRTTHRTHSTQPRRGRSTSPLAHTSDSSWRPTDSMLRADSLWCLRSPGLRRYRVRWWSFFEWCRPDGRCCVERDVVERPFELRRFFGKAAALLRYCGVTTDPDSLRRRQEAMAGVEGLGPARGTRQRRGSDSRVEPGPVELAGGSPCDGGGDTTGAGGPARGRGPGGGAASAAGASA